VERLEAAIAAGGAPAAAANGATPAGEPAPAEPAPAAATKGGQVRRRPAAPSAARAG